MKPLISIIVPVYNAENYLEKCVDSIIYQIYSNLEIILVDDGSTDLSSEMCDNYVKLDKRIIVIHKTNGGVSSARNKGLGVASGKYIGFVDSDDWIDANMYERLYKSIFKYQADISISGYVYEKPDGTIIKKNLIPLKNIFNQCEALEMALSPDYFQGFMCNKLFAASIFNSSNKIRFDEDIYIYEDLLCVCQCILKSKTIIFTGDPLYHYISIDNSAMNKTFNIKKITMLDAVYQINTLCEETYPQLFESVNTQLVKANLFVMLNIIKVGFVDVQLIDTIKKKLQAILTSSLKSKSLSNKEKLYVLLIAINPDWFANIYRLIKKLWRGKNMNTTKYYMHGGSGNHGCEAIIRSTNNIINEPCTVISVHPNEDEHFGIGELIEIKGLNIIEKYSARHILYYLKRIITKNYNHYYRYQYKLLFEDKVRIAVSIGGDNYCGYKMESILGCLNEDLNKKGVKTVLWGCSIEPDLMKNKSIVEDMNRYALITARESITFNALIEAGVNTNTKLYPDPAFILEPVNLELPLGFDGGKTVGINVSPLIQRLETGSNITYRNYKQLIEYIVENTENNVALIPHVVQGDNNDLEPLTQLYNEFIDTGRVILIGDHNCMELKGFISRCRMFIGARTHATIAAYSTCVPTLVVGYSVKAKGIAKDIFGTYENYVLPVQSLQNEDDLTKAFEWLYDHENEIRTHLQNVMPSYIEKAWQAGEEVRKLIES